MEFPETNGKAPEYHDTANLTYISNIAQLERQLQTIELSYITEKAAAAMDQRIGDSNTVIGGKTEETVDCQANNRLHRFKSVTREVYNLVKSNVGLMLLLFVYSLLGAAIFEAIEGRGAQTKEADDRDRVRNRLVKDILNATGLWQTIGLCSDNNNNTSSGLENVSTCGNLTGVEKYIADKLLKPYENSLSKFLEPKSMSPGRNIQWTYSGALYFCVTVFTTVGYGNIYPKTDLGKVATIVYAAIGIPLCLVVLSKLGKSLTRFIKFFWSYVRRFYYTGSFQRVRRMIPVSRLRRSMLQRLGDQVRRGTVRLRRRTRISDPSAAIRDKLKDPEVFVPYEVNDTFNLPPIVAIVVAFLYTVLGTFLYSSWEEWTELEAFYFTFISLCTIGFGDIVPDHPKFFLASSVYLLFGLALVAMVINVIMEAVTDTITRATERVMSVGERIIQYSPRQCLNAAPDAENQSLDMYGNGIRRKSV